MEASENAAGTLNPKPYGGQVGQLKAVAVLTKLGIRHRHAAEFPVQTVVWIA